MKIAIDTRCLGNNSSTGYGYFLYEVLKRITTEQADDEFLLIFDKPYHADFSIQKNVRVVVMGPATTNPLLLKLWYDVKLPGLLKKYKVDLVVTGPGICSLAARIPQCLVIDDLSYLCFPSHFKKTEWFFLKRYTKKFVQKADRIVVTSAFLEKEIMTRYRIQNEKISVIHGAAGIFYPLAETEKEKVRADYTDGKNYFLYAGDIDQRKNLVNLLKAFSIFKKRQKSDWKLLLAGSISPRFKIIKEKIRSYKYRDDLVLADLADKKETARLTGAAYAFVDPSTCEGSGVAVLDAMQSHVPVFTSTNSAMAEIAGDAALYFDPADHSDIAEKMMLLYKDETLRNTLVARGMEIINKYSWDKATLLFRQAIEKTAD